jgi:hypothetical protein
VLNNLSEAFLTHLLDVDHEDREAIVASTAMTLLLSPATPSHR